jgi:hypothetical protein
LASRGVAGNFDGHEWAAETASVPIAESSRMHENKFYVC